MHESSELASGYETHSQRDLFGTRDLESGALFEYTHELARLVEIFGRPTIESRTAAPNLLHGELADLEISLIEIGDFEFATG